MCDVWCEPLLMATLHYISETAHHIGLWENTRIEIAHVNGERRKHLKGREAQQLKSAYGIPYSLTATQNRSKLNVLLMYLIKTK